MSAILSLLLLATASNAREIVFPPLNSYQAPLSNFGVDNVDVSSANFAGLTTFANLPYSHCLSNNDEVAGNYDIAILGAPFDTVCRARILRWDMSSMN